MELKNRKFQTSSEKIPSNKQQPTISEVSNLFSLSAKQHAFFATIALILLKTWNDRELDKVNEIDTIITFLKTQQKLIYLTGEGGTGKSRCIEALQFFCNQWGRPDAIAKTALTGKAAVGVEGKFII
jgi:DNA replication protein DnaC